MKKISFSNRFDIMQLIGGGSFGQIYNGIDMKTGDEVAIKVEQCKDRSIQLCNEAKIYRILDGAAGFPLLKDLTAEDGLNALIIDILGDSIESLFKKANRHFSLKTVLMIAEQLLSRVQFLHSKGIVHNDLKPSNLMTGVGNKSNVIHLIDYGLATKFRGFYSNQHVEYSDGQKFFGTPEFASINSHKGIRKSRRDDLESVAYILIYLLNGNLPWNRIVDENDKAICDKILQMKEKLPIKELCQNMPEEFAQFLQAARNLGFDEEPDYAMYKKWFRDLFIKKGFSFDDHYDWTLGKLPRLQSLKARDQKARALSTRPPASGFTASSTSIPKMMKKKNGLRFNIQGMGVVTSFRSRLQHVHSLTAC